MPNVIRLNDLTSHGGKVASVTVTHFTVGGIAVAQVGDTCTCPLHGDGDGTITDGDPHHAIDGIRVAYEGHETSCGARLRSTVRTSDRYSDGGPGSRPIAGSCTAARQMENTHASTRTVRSARVKRTACHG